LETDHTNLPSGEAGLTCANASTHVAMVDLERCHTGAPSNVFVSFETTAVTVTRGTITNFSSPPGVRRGFCCQCGATMTCASDRLPTETRSCIGAFERAAELEPNGEFFADERLPWLHLQEA